MLKKINIRDLVKENWSWFLACFVISSAFVILFSYSTSPLYRDFYGYDSACYITFGKMWYKGKIPYVEFFDHKGPWIFFVNMLGFVIGGGRKYGICLLQIIFMTASLTGVYKISTLFDKSKKYAILITVLTILLMKINYINGDTVEEFCMPFINWTVYGLMKYYKSASEEKNHYYSWAFLYGITIGICSLTRLTNIAQIIGLIFVVFISLIINKQYKNLVENLVAGIVGILVVWVPFSLYFAFHHAFYEFIYGTFIHNYLYTETLTNWFPAWGSNGVITFINSYLAYHCIWVIVLVTFVNKQYRMCIAFTITALVEGYVFNLGDLYNQYPFICMVNIPIFFGMLIMWTKKDDYFKFLVAVLSIVWVGHYLVANTVPSVAEAVDKRFYRERIVRDYEGVTCVIPVDELDSFVAYGGFKIDDVYMVTNTIPDYKYCLFEQWFSQASEKVKKEIVEEYGTLKAKWILTEGNYDTIRDILETNYEVHLQNEAGYTLWRRK
ncbi:Dolichyl-phosphate-mannose-protein mannosyltransferase [Pseudobutyrivibrio sp. 49]|uniref:ArnT family glycosyltransferase n=1 Tax=Pseudobutyrivibrio sp. 49 TaxID=1855344 RepID=UPI0008864A0B|nr:glycosyltransferase family 39 protein [Pseudobutyrivibrio sp. 49]SDH59196.1 Dolichyl-phosphate-mannose-protein mannosyltransferase [Pseudobutyrivibrio sp. 49]